jgi:hypothetical protein
MRPPRMVEAKLAIPIAAGHPASMRTPQTDRLVDRFAESTTTS